MRIIRVKVDLQDGTNRIFTSESAEGLYVDVNSGVMISSRTSDTGWYMIAWINADLVKMVTPSYA